MCVVSMVHDHYNPIIPDTIPWIPPIQPGQPWVWPSPTTWPSDKITITPPADPLEELKKIEKLLEDFKNARDAAILVDKLTGQPDCVDPEKAKLEERVAKLEAEIAELKKHLKSKNKPRRKRASKTREG
jgi:hypothetical protein